MRSRLLPLAVAAGLLGSGLGLSSAAKAEKTLVETDKWEIFTDWIPAMNEVVRPLVEVDAAQYASENGIEPRTCE